MKRLYLIRGLPGSGKSTLATQLVQTSYWDGDPIEADQYFMTPHGYEYDRSQIHRAHGWCQDKVREAMRAEDKFIAVSNTFSQHWELEVYRKLAATYGYHVVEIDLFDGGMTNEELAKRNIHNCPLETIQRMKDRWEP